MRIKPVCVALAALALIPPGAEASPSLRPAAEDRVERIVERQLREQVLPGAIVAVRRDGARPWILARGVADLESRRPMERRNHFRWYLPAKRMSLVVHVNSDIHRGPVLPGYAYEPASAIASRITRVVSPRHVAPPAVVVAR